MEKEGIRYKPIQGKVSCAHCGDICSEGNVVSGSISFCCSGCKMVYDLINNNNLCDYYSISDKPGVSQKSAVREGKFDFLEDSTIQQQLISFSN